MRFIEFNDFSAFYKLKKDYVIALNNINLSIDAGEFVVLVGPSGCGKTTLLKSIFGETGGATKGEIRINGKNLDDVNIMQQNFAYVSQNYSLNPSMTIYDNIAYPLRIMKTDPLEIDKRVRSIAKSFGIYPLLTRKPKNISGGQHQRAAIARALIKNPRLILMDEPFSSLDPTIRVELRSMIKKVHERIKCTIVFVTHDLTEAFTLADRIVVMNLGKIEESGNPRELEENHSSELLKEFFNK